MAVEASRTNMIRDSWAFWVLTELICFGSLPPWGRMTEWLSERFGVPKPQSHRVYIVNKAIGTRFCWFVFRPPALHGVRCCQHVCWCDNIEQLTLWYVRSTNSLIIRNFHFQPDMRRLPKNVVYVFFFVQRLGVLAIVPESLWKTHKSNEFACGAKRTSFAAIWWVLILKVSACDSKRILKMFACSAKRTLTLSHPLALSLSLWSVRAIYLKCRD